MAVFVLVLIGGMLLMLSRQQQLSAEQSSMEVQGARAFWAAQAGLQVATGRLFPLDNNLQTCAQVPNSVTLTAAGLIGCRAELQCQSVNHPDQPSRPLFRLTSSGICSGGSDWQSSRVVELEVY